MKLYIIWKYIEFSIGRDVTRFPCVGWHGRFFIWNFSYYEHLIQTILLYEYTFDLVSVLLVTLTVFESNWDGLIFLIFGFTTILIGWLYPPIRWGLLPANEIARNLAWTDSQCFVIKIFDIHKLKNSISEFECFDSAKNRCKNKEKAPHSITTNRRMTFTSRFETI